MSIAFTRVVDITQPLYHKCPGNPAFPPLESMMEMRDEECGWNCERLNFFTHIGTHIDAPKHRKSSGLSIDAMPPNIFIGPATAVDLYYKMADEAIVQSDLEPYANALQPIVLLCTGWGEKRANSDEYIYHSPWLSAEGAMWLVEHGVRGVGIDHFSVGGTNPETVVASHDVLLDAGVWILEDLILPREVFSLHNLHVIALPLLLQGGSGAPARALAVQF